MARAGPSEMYGDAANAGEKDKAAGRDHRQQQQHETTKGKGKDGVEFKNGMAGAVSHALVSELQKLMDTLTVLLCGNTSVSGHEMERVLAQLDGAKVMDVLGSEKNDF